MNKHTYDNQKWSQDAQGYANRIGKFLKKIACQTDSNNGFSEIANNFRDKFSSGIVNDRLHRFNNNMVGNVCQTQFSRFRVFALFRAYSLDPFDSLRSLRINPERGRRVDNFLTIP